MFKKKFSSRCFLLIVLFNLIYCGLAMVILFLLCIRTLNPEQIAALNNNENLYIILGSAGAFIILGLIQWLFLKKIAANAFIFAKERMNLNKTTGKQGLKIDKEQQKKNNQRHFLHLLGIFQREGRFIDFLTEDLELYEDEQIGATVRNIHKNCSAAMKKYLSISAIINSEEDETVIIEKGFDKNQIKLQGNVIGEPPFKGILRHKGWMVKKFNLPTLSEKEDPSILSPAEVELQ